jgi:dihydrofolate synthase/folylpolyglutamate synthase
VIVICSINTVNKIISFLQPAPMNFQESCDYLYSLGNEVSAMKLGLESMTKLLYALGEPQNSYFKVQVAGTNGKGSVCAFLEAICVSAGLKIGVTTSPHLISVTERVRINGEQISETAFAELASRTRAAAEKLVAAGELEIVPTYFEQVTAVALLAFAEANVKLAILETGLGGRLDATTAASAEVAVITRIDYDHQEYLGETLGEIAAEKAAIIHDNSLVVIGEQPPDAMTAMLERCVSLGIEPKLAQQVKAFDVHGLLRFVTDRGEYAVNELGLSGRHQIENAKTAILAAEILENRFPISEESINAGLRNAVHPGRLEFYGRYLFDGAHNIGGATALREFLDESVKRPITIIFGAMRGKAIVEIAEILFPLADNVILTRPSNSRAATADELAGLLPGRVDTDKIFKTNSVAEALAKAKELSLADSIILITGSLYLVGEVKQMLEQRSEI